MSSYSYLNEDVRIRLTNLAEKALEEVSIKRPPVKFDRLYENEKLSKTLFNKLDPAINDLAKEFKVSKVEYLRGVLFVPDKRVIVISDDYEKRNNFTIAHEFGHWKIPSHRALLYKCTQFDLSPKARAQMEREANFLQAKSPSWGDFFLSDCKVQRYLWEILRNFPISLTCLERQH
jgi:hypothetical protein